MNKEDNPFYTLASYLAPKDTVQNVVLGKVTSVSPLLISCNGIQLDKEDLRINKDLLRNTQRKVKINGNTVNGSLNMQDGTIENLENVFNLGSTVVLLTNDNQKFYLICEVI
ncbi:DUF2577 family protein [Clostridium cochlearium]|uniref:DUF2577 family protein n=1 Tax=Clostridium cochlearium TaxID=1494 RepID=UPI000BBC542D|nr:DUF2577 family protein [Clostridium cochlearium]